MAGKSQQIIRLLVKMNNLGVIRGLFRLYYFKRTLFHFEYGTHNGPLQYIQYNFSDSNPDSSFCLNSTCFLVPMIPHMSLLWSNIWIYVFMLLFSFSVLVTSGVYIEIILDG